MQRKGMLWASGLFGLAAMVANTTAAQAQYRPGRAPSSIGSIGGASAGSFLSRLIDPNKLTMHHQLEMGFAAAGGLNASTTTYTNTLLYQYSPKLAMRMDVAAQASPFNNLGPNGQTANLNQIFLRNASIDYRPSDRMAIRLSMQQVPSGAYGSGYGYRPYGSGLFDNYSSFGVGTR